VSSLICVGLQRDQNCACTDIAPGGGVRPLGDNNSVSGVWYELRLAVKVDPLGGCGGFSEV